mgnify:CR=1 FL=1
MLPLLTTCYSLLTVLTAHYSHCSHYCSLLTAYQVSATKSSDSQVKTSGKAINMWWTAPWSGFPDINTLLLQDIILGFFSVVLIFTIILLNTSSLLLTLAGLFEILASIPLAMFLWMLCGQVTYLLTLLLAYFWILCGHRGPK